MRFRVIISATIFLSCTVQITGQMHPRCDSLSMVEHAYFSLCYNEKTEQASWVYYFVTPYRLKNKVTSRSDNFRPDTMVRTGSAIPNDYKGSGFDRGHLCPAGDMSFDSIAMSESFFMSNMSPQFPSFNRGIWKSLEEKVRVWGLEFDTLFVITGPVFYDTTYLFIGENKVAIPDAYYKVLLGKKDSAFDAIGFIIPNLEGLKDPLLFSKTINKVEDATGLDFFPILDDKTETEIENKKSNCFITIN